MIHEGVAIERTKWIHTSTARHILYIRPQNTAAILRILLNFSINLLLRLVTNML
jgi:hypothetical protein